MTNSTIVNATTFTVAPVMSGANIAASTIPSGSVVGTFPAPFPDITGTQTWTGVNTFTKTSITKFTTDSAGSSLYYGYLSGASASGGSNTCVGSSAGAALTSGASLSLFGYRAGASMTTVVNTTCFGANAGAAMVSTGSNAAFTAIGYNAGLANTTGTSNTYLGSGAGSSVTNGINNVCVGFNAGAAITGSGSCVFLGYQAGLSDTGNASTTCIGANTSASGFSSSSAIGYGATCTANNQIQMGTATEYVNCPGTSASGAIKLAGALFNNTAATVVSGSVSGNLSWTQSEQGSGYKRVVIYCNALLGTATVTYTTAFLHTPVIVTTSGLSSALITTGPSTTSCIVTGATSTGFLIIEGF